MSGPEAAAVEEHPAHPEVAIVLIARHGGLLFSNAVQGLAEVARSFGVQGLVLLPTNLPNAPRSMSLPFAVRVIEVAGEAPESTWRGQALAETNADVLVFVDDRKAAAMPWEDLVPYRLGLVRANMTSGTDLRRTLERMGVEPPRAAATVAAG